MALSKQTYTVSDPTDVTYDFTFDWVRAGHIEILINDVLVPGSDYAISGSSGAATVTLSGTTASELEALDTIVIRKVTPNRFSTRTVDFSALSAVTEENLDDAILHCISMIQDALDGSDRALKLDSTDTFFDATSKRIGNVAAGVDANDAATVAQITSIVTGAGNLPAVSDLFNQYGLIVTNGDWTITSPADMKTNLGLGTAAERDIGSAASDNVLDRLLGDARYLRTDQDLADIGDDSVARSNLGLGDGATLDTGTSANNLVKLDSNARLPAVDGRNLNLGSHALNQKGGGLRDCMGWFEFTREQLLNVDEGSGNVDTTFIANSSNNLEIDSSRGLRSFRNTSPVEIGINTANETFNINQGTWVIDFDLMFYCTDGADQYLELGWALVDTSDDSVVENCSAVNVPWGINSPLETSAEHHWVTVRRRILYGFTGSPKVLALRVAREDDQNVYLGKGEVFLHQLSTTNEVVNE